MTDTLTLHAARPWLVEPGRFRLLVAQALRVPCPSAREVAKARRRRLDFAKDSPARALPSTGTLDPAEEQLAGKAVRAVKGKVGVLAVHGPLEQRLSPEGVKAGSCSCEEVGAGLDALLNARDVEAVVLHVDSPGGSSYGTEELADRIYAARGRKPIYSISDSMMASAAFWVGTSAPFVACTPGGDVGSVGVYLMHLDQTAAAEAAGVKVSFVSAGKYKTEGNPFEPLGEETKGYLQELVNATYDKFLDALRRNRGASLETVRSRYGQGRIVPADKALAAGMIDRVITFEDLLRKLTGGGANGGNGARGPSAEVLRLRHERRRREAGEVLDAGRQLAYPNEHACRIADPGKFSEFRRVNGAREHDGKKYDVVYGKDKESGSWEEQTFRYPKERWTAEEARSHCKSHDGTFEAASGGAAESVCVPCGEGDMPARRMGPGLSHDSKTQENEPAWGDVDKAKLPRVAFADHGEADKKSTWGWPHHHVTGGTVDPDTGVYSSGTLWLNRGGLNAAWSAAMGGRSGQKAPPEVVAHLQAHRRALGLDKED